MLIAWQLKNMPSKYFLDRLKNHQVRAILIFAESASMLIEKLIQVLWKRKATESTLVLLGWVTHREIIFKGPNYFIAVWSRYNDNIFVYATLYQRNIEILFLIPYQFGKPNCVQVFLFPNLDKFSENHALKYLGDIFLRFSKKSVA